MKSIVSKDWEKCATCANWAGYKKIDSIRVNVEFDNQENAECLQMRISTPGYASCVCGKYCAQFKF